jgi:hypothetical protein
MIYTSSIPKHIYSWNNDDDTYRAVVSIDAQVVSVHTLDEQDVTFPIDPLVISCCRYRRSKKDSLDYDHEAEFATLSDYAKKSQTVTEEDFALAASIRTYFTGKATFTLLRGEALTKFKQDLSALLTLDWSGNQGIIFPSKYVKMIYKLPFFYEHDMIIENEVFDFKERQPIQHKYQGWESVSLYYIRSVSQNSKKKANISYWFKDSNGTRFCIDIDKTNSLIPAWEQLIKLGPITIKGGYIELSYNTLQFYRVTQRWQILS